MYTRNLGSFGPPLQQGWCTIETAIRSMNWKRVGLKEEDFRSNYYEQSTPTLLLIFII